MRYSNAQFVLTLVDFMASNDGSIFRIMKESLECGLVAYQVPTQSPYRETVENTIQRARESGLYQIYVEWTLRFLRSVYRPLLLPDAKQSRPVSWSGLSGVFYVYGAGVTLATVAFLVEWTVCRAWWRSAFNSHPL